MLKKTVALGSIVTALCGAAEANTSCHYKSGWLLGAHVGAAFGEGKFTGTVILPGSSTSATGKARKTSAVIGLIGGYRHLFNEGFTIAGVLEANLYTANEISKSLSVRPVATSIPFTQRLKRNYSFIPAVQFGKIFCGRYHAYLGLGLGVSNFKQSMTVATNAAGATFTGSGTQTKLGFVPSVGIEYAATQNVSLLANVSYEMYQKTNKTFAVPAVAGGSIKSSVSPNYWNLKIGAVYRF